LAGGAVIDLIRIRDAALVDHEALSKGQEAIGRITVRKLAGGLQPGVVGMVTFVGAAP